MKKRESVAGEVEGRRCDSAVEVVADNRCAEMGCMHPNLMSSPGEGLRPEKGGCRRCPVIPHQVPATNRSKCRDRPLTTCRHNLAEDLMAWVAANIIINCLRLCATLAGDFEEVGFFN